MNEEQQDRQPTHIPEDELEAIRRMRDFRRTLSVIVTLLVLLATILLAVRSIHEHKPARKSSLPGLWACGKNEVGVSDPAYTDRHAILRLGLVARRRHCDIIRARDDVAHGVAAG